MQGGTAQIATRERRDRFAAFDRGANGCSSGFRADDDTPHVLTERADRLQRCVVRAPQHVGDRLPGHRLRSGSGEVVERVAEVGSHVGAHRVPGEGARDAPAREVVRRHRLHRGGDGSGE